MITFIARLRIKEGREAEAFEGLQEMVASVQANEPGALAYCCHRSADDPLEVVFYEVYADEAAKEAHAQTPHFQKLISLIGDVLDGDFGVKVEDLAPVAAFCRELGGP